MALQRPFRGPETALLCGERRSVRPIREGFAVRLLGNIPR